MSRMYMLAVVVVAAVLSGGCKKRERTGKGGCADGKSGDG